MPLILLFILIPVIEVMLLFRLSDAIGGLNTFLIVIITGIIGANLARSQGVKVLTAINKDLNSGEMPTDHLFSGVLVLIGGVLLITPGVLTDFVGFMLMIPGNRKILMKVLKENLKGRYNIHAINNMNGMGNVGGMQQEPFINEVESRVVEDENENRTQTD